jgi:hypothetical protein
MTYNPADLIDLMAYWTAHGGVNLGIKGDASHVTKARSYHLGADQLTDYTYSGSTARDKAGLATWPNAASAVDLGELGGSIVGLRRFSGWFVGRCRANAPGTSDVRDFIYSLDGVTVLRWDRERGVASTPRAGEADTSHLKHSHISFYRDSRERDKTPLFRPYFEEDDVQITEVNAEDWKPGPATAPQRRPIRATPDRAGGVIVGWVEVGEIIRTIAEAKTDDGNVWRLTERAQDPGWLLRSDFVALVQGGDAALHAQFDAFMARVPPVECPPAVDCAPLVNAARQEGATAGLRDGARAVKDAAVNAAVLLGG